MTGGMFDTLLMLRKTINHNPSVTGETNPLRAQTGAPINGATKGNNVIRLNRFLSASGFSSRRKGEEIIRAGRIAVNGAIVTDPAFGVEPATDTMTADGERLSIPARKRWFLLNKPEGVIVSRDDPQGRETAYDILGPETDGVFNVGRLDYDTSGVLLFTDDGDMTHRLTHPSWGVVKVYRARVKGAIGDGALQKLAEGVKLEDGVTSPAGVELVDRGGGESLVEIAIHEGRNRQVRRMFEAVGHPVLELERLSFGGITAGSADRGSYRPLADTEIETLKRAVSRKRRNAEE